MAISSPVFAGMITIAICSSAMLISYIELRLMKVFYRTEFFLKKELHRLEKRFQKS